MRGRTKNAAKAARRVGGKLPEWLWIVAVSVAAFVATAPFHP